MQNHFITLVLLKNAEHYFQTWSETTHGMEAIVLIWVLYNSGFQPVGCDPRRGCLPFFRGHESFW